MGCYSVVPEDGLGTSRRSEDLLTDSTTPTHRPPPGSDVSPEAVDVTIVMPIRNEAAHIEQVLADVLGQDTGDLRIEVLVVDGRSTDDTRARVQRVVDRDARVRLLDNPQRLSSAARARGTREARGRFVTIVDGHCRIPSTTLWQDMVALFERTGADCLARPQPLVPGDAGPMARAIAAARTSPFGHSLGSTIYDDREREVSPTSAGASYRREVFEQVGTFDPTFDACEDVELNYRCEQAGLLCWTSPKLAVQYEPRRTLRALYKQMHRYGLGRARLHRKHPSAFSWESLVPAGFVAGVPVAVLGGLLLPAPWRWVAVAPYALYLVLTAIASLVTARRAGWSLLPRLPFVFPTIHAGLGVGYLTGWMTRRPRPAAPPEAEPLEARVS